MAGLTGHKSLQNGSFLCNKNAEMEHGSQRFCWIKNPQHVAEIAFLFLIVHGKKMVALVKIPNILLLVLSTLGTEVS